MPTPLQSFPVAATASASTSVSGAFTTANLSAFSTVIAMIGAAAGSASNPSGPSATCGGTSMSLIGSISQGPSGSNVLVALFALNTPVAQVGTKPTVQAQWTNSATTSLLVQEVPGIISATGAGLTDGSAATHGASSSPLTTGSYTTTQSAEYTVVAYGDDGGPSTVATPAGWTADANNINTNSHANGMIFYKNSVGGSESASSTITSPVNWGTIIVAFVIPFLVQPIKARQAVKRAALY